MLRLQDNKDERRWALKSKKLGAGQFLQYIARQINLLAIACRLLCGGYFGRMFGFRKQGGVIWPWGLKKNGK
jgi:hypothetical protein